MFEAAEYILPPLNKVADRDFNVIKGRPPMASTLNQHRWILGSDGRFYNYDYFQLASQRRAGHPVRAVRVRRGRQGLAAADRLYAARAVWDGVAYDLERGLAPHLRADGHVHRRSTRPTAPARSSRPSYFNREDRASDTMSFGELQRAHRVPRGAGARRHQAAGASCTASSPSPPSPW